MIAGSVVLYYPDKELLLSNIKTYLPFVDHLYVIDNTPALGNMNIITALGSNTDKVEYVHNNQNLGIARALNIAVDMALADGYEWMLTMDQDSAFREADIQSFVQQLDELKPDGEVAIIATSHNHIEIDKPNIENVKSVITSGNIVRISAWQTVGGFDERLFIDEVDYDFCYKLILSGYKILKINQVALQHNLGFKKEKGYLGINKTSRTLHNEKRIYFMVRNYLFVRKKYGTHFKEEFKIRDKQLLTALKNNLLFSGHFFKNLKNIYKGYKDFKRNKFTAII